MEAWRISSHGGNEVLKWSDLETPEPGPGEARVRVQAVGLNHLDLWVRNGVPGHQFPLPITPGCDVAGVVDALGPLSAGDVTTAPAVGSEILVNPLLSCGKCKACLEGFQPVSTRFGIVGESTDGGCAEYVVVPVRNLIERPQHLGAVEAASLPTAYVTAWSMLTRKAKLQPGEFALIHAGGSGVGVAAIQVAKLLGATVITTIGSDDKITKVKALGADHVINYKNTPFRKALKAYLSEHGKRGVDVVLDHVGVETFNESLKSLDWGGRLATCGATTGADIQLDLKLIFFKNISVLGSTMGSQGDLLRILGLIQNHQLKPVIDSTFPMNELPQALAKLESRKIFGKVVVTA